jgi:hypothetical protein
MQLYVTEKFSKRVCHFRLRFVLYFEGSGPLNIVFGNHCFEVKCCEPNATISEHYWSKQWYRPVLSPSRVYCNIPFRHSNGDVEGIGIIRLHRH